MGLSKDSITEIIKRLKRFYSISGIARKRANPFWLLVETMLSARCTDNVSERLASNLFKKYKNIKNMAGLSQQELERQIYSAGFYRQKAKNIIASSRKIIMDYKGIVPSDMGDLLELPGVGRKTANIVLSAAFRKSKGIAVDTHVKRIARRLRLSREDNPEKIERDLLKIVPRHYWLDFNYILVNYGRRICKPRKPLCYECIIKEFCPSGAPRLNSRGSFAFSPEPARCGSGLHRPEPERSEWFVD